MGSFPTYGWCRSQSNDERADRWTVKVTLLFLGDGGRLSIRESVAPSGPVVLGKHWRRLIENRSGERLSFGSEMTMDAKRVPLALASSIERVCTATARISTAGRLLGTQGC